MPGAGEHLEPGEKLKFKSSVIRAFTEEMGINEDILSKCFLISLGNFDSPGRDPRYWLYSKIDIDGVLKTFGAPRYSSTQGYMFYYKGVAPKLQAAHDFIEVTEMKPNEKKWLYLETLDVTGDTWMIEDHCKIVSKAKLSIKKFNKLDKIEQDDYLLLLDSCQKVKII